LIGRKGRGLTAGLLLALGAPVAADGRPGAVPATPWACPASHPIKGYVAEEYGRLFFRPGTRYYEEASPERCYASEDEARRDGARRAPDDEPLPR
jgi:hypothetical protein